MKALKIELRMWFAEKLLGWSFCVAPKTNEGDKIKKMILEYTSEKITEFIKEQ